MKKHISASVLIAGLVLLLSSGALGARLYLRSKTIDTQTKIETAAVSVASIPGANYYLVALKGPIKEDDKQSLRQAGAELIEYIPDNAFLVRIDNAKLGALKKLPICEWVGLFKPEYKLAGTLQASGKQMQFLVTLFPGQSSDHVMGKGKLLGVRKVGCAADMPSRAVCRVLANNAQLADLMKDNAVAWVEPYIQPRLCNDVATTISGVPEVRQGLGLFGANQLIGLADTGIDTGDLSTISSDFANRIYKTYSLRRQGEWSDLRGHGTHVGGSLLGSGVSSGSNPSTHNYAGSFAGYAPEAQLDFQSIGDAGEFVFPPLHLSELFQPTYDDGARVHSNSWGSAAKGQYTTYSNEVDQFIWDHKDFTAVFAVGNEGDDLNRDGISDRQTVYAPATAKNCIAVGATESLRSSGGCQTGYGEAWPDSFKDAPIKYDLVSNNIAGMAAFSGRGPTADGRVKPDICAPGTNIISCRSHSGSTSTGWEVYNQNYIYWGGTSMSTPQVAGAAALVREYYQTEKRINPSAALIKATLINGAIDVSPGQYGTGSRQETFPVPDNSQGWGRLNLKQSLFPDPPLENEFADESSALSTGDAREYQYAIVDTSMPFRVTLVWTDYPGSVNAAKELVNDLDLAVLSPTGAIYNTFDNINNVEQIVIPQPEAGTYRVRVTGHNIPMGPQDYALAVSGGMPNTYVSGTVTSTSGACVTGTVVSLVSSSGVKRLTTNSSGKYITHISPGAYSVQVAKAGWTFTPPARVVQVTSQPVDNVDFNGQGKPGSTSGAITSAIGGVVNYIVESMHPYLNNLNQTYTITAHEGATCIRIHLAEIDLMNDGDTVYVLDGNDRVLNTYTGQGEDIWSSWATGHVIKIKIVSNDFGNIGYGFYADGYETDLISQGALDGATLTLSPGNYQTASSSNGVYNFASVPPGTYTVTPSKAHWKFQPTSKQVEVPAASSTTGVDFTAFPPGSITGEVHVASLQSNNLSDVESPHPYPINYDRTWVVTADPTASRIRLHFSKISTEPGFDLICLLDGNDSIVEIYTSVENDLWTPWIDGNVAKIELSTDGITVDYGFTCDKYEAQVASGGLSGVKVSLPDCGVVSTTNDQGAFDFANVDIGNHTIVPERSLWRFDPQSTLVSVSPGTAEHITFYAEVLELTKPIQSKLIDDGIQITLKGATVSAVFNKYFYVQDADRMSGIRVNWPQSVEEGKVVDITGTMVTVDGERRIDATDVIVW